MPTRPFTAALITLVATATFAATAHAQWTVTSLHPPGATYSYAFAGQAGRIGGCATFARGTPYHAGFWTGSAASWSEVHPSGFAGHSIVYGRGEGDLVGVTYNGDPPDWVYHAALWTGSSGAWIDLNPASASQSAANAAAAGRQGGWASFGSDDHAGLWQGTPESWVDLNPPGATRSYVYAMGEHQQGGAARVVGSNGAQFHAAMWSGTAESWVDLHPAGAISSRIYAIDGGRQAGVVAPDVNGDHASLWTGTAASWVDLNPLGASSSSVNGGRAGWQVGHARIGNYVYAGVWHGSASSWDVLPNPPGPWPLVYAIDAWVEANTLFVVGYGYTGIVSDATLSHAEALLWTRPLPCPADLDNDGDFANGLTSDGAVTIEDLLSFLVGFEAGNVLVDLDNGTSTGTPDNAVDINDLLFFLARFEAGC